jgi:hypothetical protein
MSNFGDTKLDNCQLQQLRASINLPPEIQAAVDVNPHLFDPMMQIVSAAVQISFGHHMTKMRVITAVEIADRAHICLNIIEQAHAEQGFTLTQLKDILPQLLIDVLCQAKDGNVLIEEQHQKGRWATGGDHPETELLKLEHAATIPDTRGDPEEFDEDEVDGDLTEGVEPDPLSDEEFDKFKEQANGA